MDYKMIAKIYNINVTATLNKGKLIDDQNMRLSNSLATFNRFFNNEAFTHAIGFLEFESLQNSIYMYQSGGLKQLQETFKSHSIKGEANYYYINSFLRKIDIFMVALWLVKDHSVNIETGFIVTGTNKNVYSVTSSNTAFLSSKSNGLINDTMFTIEEINEAIQYYKLLHPEINPNIGNQIADGPYKVKSLRVPRAFYFLQAARHETDVPVKIMKYCTILECLFTTGRDEITHKISERFARLMSEQLEQREYYFSLVKKSYAIRSTVIHGQSMSEKRYADAFELAIELDNAIRELLLKIILNSDFEKKFEQNEEDLERWFRKLILS
ncbi:HEPN domain-containing protein [Bacillus cereus]|uniref:Uncharacterized protein n=1 Tax=Bacillus cereus TaxID=1396 RepID=A0A0G8EDB1_BACCE|nr:HEPN domain-containing protein [Bacillus cereus]KLA22289.1 hypothetical protein B4077_3235 [Bacillus cereus]